MLRALLVCHPDSISSAVRRIEVLAERRAGDVLAVTYVLSGDLEQLRFPAWQARQPGERLWEHTCFEAFVSRPGTVAYHELDFAPSGAWAAYAFGRYREGAPFAAALRDPHIVVRRSLSTFELEASIFLEHLSPDYTRASLEIGLSAVIEDSAGGLSYWALAHAAGKPDFHHREGFVLNMDPGSSP